MRHNIPIIIFGGLIFFLGFILPFIVIGENNEFKSKCYRSGGYPVMGPDRNGANTGGRNILCIKDDRVIFKDYITG